MHRAFLICQGNHAVALNEPSCFQHDYAVGQASRFERVVRDEDPHPVELIQCAPESLTQVVSRCEVDGGERLLDNEIAGRFFAAVVKQAKLRRYISGEHFSVDGTLLEAWASHKSFRPKDEGGPPIPPGAGRNAGVDFHGERRTNETHRSTTDPESRMARKGNAVAAKLSYAGHLLLEHRSALIVDMELNQATGHAERATALAMLRRLPATKRRRTVAGDRGYDTKDFVRECRAMGVTPHVAQNTTNRSSAIDGRTTRHRGHGVSLRIRKRIEEPFGWMKTVAGGRKLRYIGQRRNRAWFLMAGAVYDILRIAALDAQIA